MGYEINKNEFEEYETKMNKLEDIHNRFDSKIRLLTRNGKCTKTLDKLDYIEYKKELMIEEL